MGGGLSTVIYIHTRKTKVDIIDEGTDLARLIRAAQAIRSGGRMGSQGGIRTKSGSLCR